MTANGGEERTKTIEGLGTAAQFYLCSAPLVHVAGWDTRHVTCVTVGTMSGLRVGRAGSRRGLGQG